MKDAVVKPARIFRYLCPEQHETSVRNEQAVAQPLYTAVICRAPVGDGKTCNQFSIYVEDRDRSVKSR